MAVPGSRFLVLAAMILAVGAGAASARSARDVVIGGDDLMVACAATGRIVNLRADGDNFLSVRAGPSAAEQETDRLGPGALVHLCEEAGMWLGIVYPADEHAQDCAVSSPAAARNAYVGPCRSGWVDRRFVELVAG